MLGSSPLARGSRRSDRLLLVGRGLIPARAGLTAGARMSLTMGRAHPRSRGAHSSEATRRMRERGSSPFARGSQHGRQEDRRREGLIPARAGLTGRRRRRTRSRGAHPRSRGAHTGFTTGTTASLGSSPLARGSLAAGAPGEAELGLIPARAGLTADRWSGTAAERAHPRSRGAHPARVETTCEPVGSSPLARGSPRPGGWFGAGVGLIPARAGLTSRLWATLPRGRAHPRSRGAHSSASVTIRSSGGSSPLARGSL